MSATTTPVARRPLPAPPDVSWAPLGILLIGTFMVVLDFFAVNVAVPSLQTDLGASAADVEWVVAGFGVALASLLVAAARLGDRFGRRRLLMVGVALLTAASAVCGAAPDPAVLIGARVAQGIGAALLMPNVLSLMGVLYPGPHQARAVSMYGMVMGAAAAAGQLIGGGLIQADLAGLGWRSVFLVNVPIGLVALAGLARLVPESRVPVRSPFDALGTVLVTGGLVALVLPLIEGRQEGWPAWTWASLAAALALLGAFLARQRSLGATGREPLLDLRLFAERRFSAGLAAQLVMWCAQASFFLFFALFVQQAKGLDPLEAGGLFTVLAGSFVATSLPAPALTLRYGRRVPAAGTFAKAVGHLGLLVAVVATGTHGPLLALVPGLVLVGAGMGACLTPLTITVLAGADAERAGAVSGLLSTMQQVGATVGVAVVGLVFYGLIGRGQGPAFIWVEAALAALMFAAAALTALLPRR